MILASRALLLRVQFGPGTKPPCAVGKLMERLAHELRTGQSPMNPYRFTTAFRYRRYTRELLDLQSGLKTIPICAEGRQQPRG